ncbi:MAG: hypothetical protein KIH09_13565 [Candidatus Freyarchaeota archaeon]|nr:hypothetical protein [Candidatus Jordarchaeia archaeon]
MRTESRRMESWQRCGKIEIPRATVPIQLSLFGPAGLLRANIVRRIPNGANTKIRVLQESRLKMPAIQLPLVRR